MALISSNLVKLPDADFKEKVRCGEVYRNLHGNEMFQKFYYRCSECSLDFESSPEFEEHVIAHYLQEGDDCTTVDNFKNNENIIDISSDDEEENGYLYAFEVASLVEENVSENDLPLPLMQMLGEQSTEISDATAIQHQLHSESDEDDERNVAFPCEGLRKQALHQYSEHQCSQCPAAYFNSKIELDFHLHIHMLSNTVVCPHCYEVFENIPKLNEHISLIKKKRIRKDEVKMKEITNENESSQNCKKAKNQSPDMLIYQKEAVRKDNKEIVERFPDAMLESFKGSEENNINSNVILKCGKDLCEDDKT